MIEKAPDMDEMIEACKKKQTENEVIVFAIGAGRIIPMFGKRNIMKKTLAYIESLDGFVGIHPIDLWHTLLIFDTLNNAKGARNLLKAKGVPLGQVAPILVQKQFLNKEG